MRIGVIDLLVDTVVPGRTNTVYAGVLRRQYASIMPQAISVWCRQLGHDVFYATYYAQGDPKGLLPDDLDTVFVSAYTQASHLAYALAKLYRREGTVTVIGGPHAKAFPEDCRRFFDLVVKECDKALIEEILGGHFDSGAVITSGRPLTDLPSVEERMPEITASQFLRGRPTRITVIPLLASIGCPYSCDFCVDWSNKYIALDKTFIADDLRFISQNLPRVFVAYHDPNFGVRFDETMDIIEALPEGQRNPYIMESSLSILKEARLPRLSRTNCAFVAPGIESWNDYSQKAGVGAKRGRAKLDQVTRHFELLRRFVPGLQANFIFGTDLDRGREPVELTRAFMNRLPFVWPAINVLIPYGGTPLHEKYSAHGRILKSLPLAFYCAPYLATTLEHYDPVEYYDHLIDMYVVMTSNRMLARRILAKAPAPIRIAHVLRTFAMRQELAEQRRLRKLLVTDTQFRSFQEGRSDVLPDFFHRRITQRLGSYAELLSHADRIPIYVSSTQEPAAAAHSSSNSSATLGRLEA